MTQTLDVVELPSYRVGNSPDELLLVSTKHGTSYVRDVFSATGNNLIREPFEVPSPTSAIFPSIPPEEAFFSSPLFSPRTPLANPPFGLFPLWVVLFILESSFFCSAFFATHGYPLSPLCLNGSGFASFGLFLTPSAPNLIFKHRTPSPRSFFQKQSLHDVEFLITGLGNMPFFRDPPRAQKRESGV